MGTRYRLPASRGGDGVKTYVRWDAGFGLVDPPGCDPDNPAAPNYCARMNLATTFHTHTDDSAVCCTSNNPSACDLVVPGQPNYPLLLSRTCADVGRITGVDDNVTSDWIFTGGKGTRFYTDPNHQLAGQMAGVCTANRLRACFRPEATQLCTAPGVPYSCCTGNLAGTCGTECLAPDTCDLRERGYRGQVRCGRFNTQTSNNGNPDPRCCATSVTVLRGEPSGGCTLLPRFPVNGDPGPGCQLQNYGIDRRDDDDCNGVADFSNDICPFLSEWDQDLDSDDDCPGPGCRGDECECGDQSGDGDVTVSDLVQINLVIFGSTDEKLICDGNNDAACNVSDIVAANGEVFVPDSSTCRHITSSRCNDGVVDLGEICDDGPRVCHGVCTGGSNPGTPCDGNSGSGATTPCLGGGVCSVPPNKGALCSGSDITPCGGPATCAGRKTCRDGAFAGQLCTQAGECGTTLIGGQPRPSTFCDPTPALGGDGCNAGCRQEFGWTCTNPPGGGSTCTRNP
jgi:cysteine-rich repeat protein